MTADQFFKWMREQKTNKKLTQAQVDGANELIAVLGVDAVKAALTKINGWEKKDKVKAGTTGLSVSESGIEMICTFEGFRSEPYLDIAGVWTIGFGTTYYPNGKRVRSTDTPITRERALEIKRTITDRDFSGAINILFADEIRKGVIGQNQFDALVSLAYNIGVRGLSGSSVTRNIKAGNLKKAAASFLLWNKARVKGRLRPVKGLTNRRKQEAELFKTANA